MAKICHCIAKYHRRTNCKCMLHCCDKVPSIVLPSQEEIKIQQKRVQRYNFMLTITFYVVLFASSVPTTSKEHIHCIPQCLDMKVPPKYTPENNLCY